jgi:hypothetical protein
LKAAASLEPVSNKDNKMKLRSGKVLKAEIGSLKSENSKMKKKTNEDEKEQRGINLCESGMGDLVYHLGFCSDVIGDCWIEHYYSGGVSALKKQLRKSSEYVHKDDSCEKCKRLIDGIHD